MTALSAAPNGVFDFEYRGTGEQRLQANSTQREHTMNPTIASYSESETQWLDRTLALEIPAEALADAGTQFTSKSGDGFIRRQIPEYRCPHDRAVARAFA